eukprot:TRINITY_DN24976_c0_g2_i1.p1 TRINITY_DN24976_c0_g2~~TRINITY_DN24976_c0_g2_i1.p1  ORF type:complete len:322 (-),score=38.28 TRINITY_DN24976_c0_g2_i1:192-1157(-)
MARCRQCVYSFIGVHDNTLRGGILGNAGDSVNGGTTPAAHSSAASNAGAGPRPAGSGDAAAPEDYEVPYEVRVEGFERARGFRGRTAPMVYTMTIRHGNAQWPIRRRYRQVARLHQQLMEGLGRNHGLPPLPPKLTVRLLLFGGRDRGFLEARRAALQRYLDALLAYIPYVDQCEALRDFLCTVDQGFLDDYERILGLEEGMGKACEGIELLDEAAVASLPRRLKSGLDQRQEVSGRSVSACVICQDPLEDGDEEDVRVLPCGHEYHFRCISRWLAQSNSCCICQAIVTASWCSEAAAHSEKPSAATSLSKASSSTGTVAP